MSAIRSTPGLLAGPRARQAGVKLYRGWRLWIEPERLVMRKVVRSWLGLARPGSVVLEIGAGTAFMRSSVEERVRDVRYISSDIAPTDNTSVVLDACFIPLADRSVDFVMALEVLEHMPEPEGLVAEAARVLADQGRLVITVPFMFGVHDFRDYHRFTPLGMETLLARHGLRVDEVKVRGGVFVAATGLIRTRILNAIVGRPADWRAQGRGRKVRWVASTVVLTPWVPVTLLAYAADRVVDRDPVSPPGYFFLATRVDESA